MYESLSPETIAEYIDRAVLSRVSAKAWRAQRRFEKTCARGRRRVEKAGNTISDANLAVFSLDLVFFKAHLASKF